jgi:hypothetical protein
VNELDDLVPSRLSRLLAMPGHDCPALTPSI